MKLDLHNLLVDLRQKLLEDVKGDPVSCLVEIASEYMVDPPSLRARFEKFYGSILTYRDRETELNDKIYQRQYILSIYEESKTLRQEIDYFKISRELSSS